MTEHTKHILFTINKYVTVFSAGGFVFSVVQQKLDKNYYEKKNKATYCGAVRVDNSEEGEQPRLFLELTNEGYNKIMTSDKIELDVIHENYIKK